LNSSGSTQSTIAIAAAEARRIAEATSDPHTRSDFLLFERRWLSLARGFEAEAGSWQRAA
jgi:hypothetical protein